jgi:hypothetical protein
MNDAFRVGVVEGMDKEAGIRTGLLGLGSGVARRLGRGTGSFGSFMDRLSTSLTNKRRGYHFLTKSQASAKANVKALKQGFKAKAPDMAPAARDKARQVMRNKITKERSALQSSRQGIREKYFGAQAPGPTPRNAPAPPAPAATGDKPKRPWYTSRPAIGGAGLALGAAGTMGIAAGMRSAQPTTVAPARY